MQVKKHINDLQEKKSRLIEKLLNAPPMIRGTFGTIYVKCGGANCKCTKGEKHPYNRLTWSENGRPKSRVVPVDEINWIKEMTQNYRCYKKVKKEMEKVDDRLKVLLTRFEVAVVEKTRKSKDFIGPDRETA